MVNNFASAPENGYSVVSQDELKQSYEQEYAGYGGSQAAAAELAAGANGTPVQTGDTTAIIPYVIAVLAALIILIAAVFFRKKKK